MDLWSDVWPGQSKRFEICLCTFDRYREALAKRWCLGSCISSHLQLICRLCEPVAAFRGSLWQAQALLFRRSAIENVFCDTSVLESVHPGCAGFTGADLQNLMNEAAILAARRSLKEISKEEISDALERIVAGPEKKGAVMTEQKKRLVAYHEVRPPVSPSVWHINVVLPHTGSAMLC